MALVAILFLSFLLRFLFLDKVPTSIAGDELTYILTVKSFLLTGYDITGTFSPWQLFFFHYPPTWNPQAELPYFLLMPFLSGDFSLSVVRLPFVILGVGTVFAVYLVAKELFNQKTALLAAFFTAICPWLIVMNRTAYEMTPAMLFYTLGLYVLLRTKGWKIFFAFPLLVLAFYSYIATKLVFFPFILLTIGYLYFFKNKRKYGLQYGMFLLLAFSFLILFVVLIKTQNNSRLGDMLLPNSPVIVDSVNGLRSASLHMPFENVFVNKFTIYGFKLTDHLFTTLSPSYLFVTGDTFFGLWRHGLFYVLDLVFIVLGGLWLVRSKKPLFVFLVGTIVIGLLPQIIHNVGDAFTPHITFIFPFMLILSACGVMSCIDFFKRRANIVLGAIIVVYGVFLANFLVIYFSQYPLQGQSDFSSRLLSRYVALAAQDGHKVIVYSNKSTDNFIKHLFYASVYSPKDIKQMSSKTPHVANVTFQSCNDKLSPNQAKEIVITTRSCEEKIGSLPHTTIPQLKDGGGVYSIYNDVVCKKYSLKHYPSGLRLSDFAVENLSKEKFCTTFITSL
jgi:4-amino-4-deoxy-L-arabinose transferase-like glycosyltransferase